MRRVKENSIMRKDSMTSRERWLAVLSHRIPDRIPMDYWGTPEATRKLMKHLGCESGEALFTRLHIDTYAAVRPEYVGPSLPAKTDIFGCKTITVRYNGGEYEECATHPLSAYSTIDEIERNYSWPSPDWYDYTVVTAQLAGKEERPIMGGVLEPFWAYKNLRGQEQAYMDLLLYPEIVHYCLDKMYDFYYEDARRIYEQIPGEVMLAYVSEDLGAQEDLIFSPNQIREFFLPRMKRIMDLVHSAGAHVFHHDDGAIQKIIPDLIETGIDILNPIQWRCKGMDRSELKKHFGNSCIFHGGVDNQQTLAFGSVEDVRREVEENIAVLGKGGGYILAPCHNIQSVSPPENIVAMYEAGYEYGGSI